MKRLTGFLLIGIGVVILLVSLLSFFQLDRSSEEEQVERSIDDYKAIELASTAVDWNIEPYDGDELFVSLSDSNRNRYFNVTERRKSIEIEVKERGFSLFNFNFFSEPATATVYLPESYHENVSIETVSGKVLLYGNYELQSLDASTVSGKINIEQLESEQANLNTVSGAIAVEAFSGNLRSDTVSGNTSIQYIDENQDATIESVSGRIELTVPEANAFVSFNTISGNWQIEQTLTEQSLQKRRISGKIGEGLYEISISTTSGNLYID